MKYQYENIILEIEAPKGSVIVDGKLMFKGHSYLAIKEFIRFSGNAKPVIQRFKAQLNMRETPRFADQKKKQEEYEAKLPTKEEFKMTLSQTPKIARKKEKWKDPFK
tara:strand:+ start:1129 stop:1449 length:321 start_codon:yes stop_codon:yes gene_type:complete